MLEEMRAGDYNHVIATAMDLFDVDPYDEDDEDEIRRVKRVGRGRRRLVSLSQALGGTVA